MNTDHHEVDDHKPKSPKGHSSKQEPPRTDLPHQTKPKFRMNASPTLLALFQPLQKDSATSTPTSTTTSPTSLFSPSFSLSSPSSPTATNQKPTINLKKLISPRSPRSEKSNQPLMNESSLSAPSQSITKPTLPARSLTLPSLPQYQNLPLYHSLKRGESENQTQLKEKPPNLSSTTLNFEEISKATKLHELSSNNFVFEPRCSAFVEMGHLTIEALGSHSIKRTGPNSFLTHLDVPISYPPDLLHQQMGKVLITCQPLLQKSLEKRLFGPFQTEQEAAPPSSLSARRGTTASKIKQSFLTDRVQDAAKSILNTHAPISHNSTSNEVQVVSEEAISKSDSNDDNSFIRQASSLQPGNSPRSKEDVEDEANSDLEESECTEDLVFMSGDDGRPKIKGGTVEKLIERLTHERYPNPDYVTTFLLTYRSFTTPVYVLDQLVNRFHIEPPSDCSQVYQERFIKRKQKPIRLRVCNTLKHWLEKHYYDFADLDLVKKLEDFLLGPLINHGFEDVSQRLQNLLKKKQALALQAQPPQIMRNTSGTRLSRRGVGFSQNQTLFSFEPAEVAKQLTAIEFEYFQAIQPKECLNQAWNKAERDVLAPNIINMIRRTNIVPFWVGTEIVYCDSLKTRKSLIQFFISVAEKCRQLRNYNAVMEIVSGLQISAVHRLKRTWEIISKKKMSTFRELVDLMAVSNNWKNYREVLKQCNPPALPYLGMYLTDLTFLEDGSPDRLDNTDLINFVKKTKLSLIIRNIQQYQQMSYNMEVISTIRELLVDMQWMDENKLWSMSLKCEPRV
eukprot:TRINITY_DN13356_c0_g1_i1.p1 TRINITY_DN13356_c0_g1~~TRINITY_DN13356_c0_g1_i1.p1  ORF type:complete len:791 (-),score=164.51 TRINITY_DN13356_c0_g1_i1:68-2440(-)